MNRIYMQLKPGMPSSASVENLTSNIPGLVKEWETLLIKSSEMADEQLYIPYYRPSTIPSQNFSVIGMQLRTICSFLRAHEFPRTVVILCDSKDTAEIYKQIYNFYIADSKENGIILTA